MTAPERRAIRTDGGTDDEPWRVGTATRVITPEAPMWMAGYGRRDHVSEGVDEDLHARAVAIEDEVGTRVVVVSVEVLGFTPDLRAAVEDACADSYDLASDRLLLNASHTHNGPEYRPDAYGILGAGEGHDERAREYRDRLERELIEAVGEALEDRSSAALRYNNATCGIAMNRRLPTEDRIRFKPYSDGAVDHDVPVLVATSGGEVTALLFGYACHPTSLPHTYRYHGDWAGLAMANLEECYDTTAAFVQGCGGDIKAYPQREVEYTEQHGRTLATAVEAAVVSRGKTVHGPLQTVQTEVTLEFEEPPSREELDDRVADGDDRHAQRLLDELDREGRIQTEFPYPVQAIGFGNDLTLLGLAGEVLADYSLSIKDRLEGDVWVAGYSNEGYLYVPARRHVYEGGYEAGWVSLYWDYPMPPKPTVEDVVTGTVLSLAERVGARRTDH